MGETYACIYPYHLGDRTLPGEHFGRNAKSKSGYTSWCRVCMAAYRTAARRDRRSFQRLHATSLVDVRPLVAGQEPTFSGPSMDLPAIVELPSGEVCDSCANPLSLQHYAYGEKYVGLVKRRICDNCDLIARAAHDNPERLLVVALFLLGCRKSVEIARTALRAHSEPSK